MTNDIKTDLKYQLHKIELLKSETITYKTTDNKMYDLEKVLDVSDSLDKILTQLITNLVLLRNLS